MGEDRRRKKLLKEQHAYVDQLKSYQDKGVPILIDGRAVQMEQDWYKIFEVKEDGTVYMADYVNTEEGRLSEIHFDLVYLDRDARQAWENRKRLEEIVRKAQIQHYRSFQCRREKEQEKRGKQGNKRAREY